jgi:general secretion pathway protein N
MRKWLIVAGLATFVAGLTLAMPARTAYTWFAPDDLRLSGISGTIWNGAATEGSVGSVYLRNLHWSFSPLALLKGRIACFVESDTSFGSISGEAGVNVAGKIILSNLDGTLSLQAFSNQFQLQGFDGTLQAQFERLTIDAGLPVEATGNIRLLNLLAPNISPLVIGNYQADFSSNADGITGSVEDLGGVLDVAGVISIGRDRSYSFVGKVAALPDAPRGLADQLRLLGSADDRGQRDFRIEGQF